MLATLVIQLHWHLSPGVQPSLVQWYYDHAIGPDQGIDKVRLAEDRLSVQPAISVKEAHLYVVLTPRH
jgi:hypothetical protein